jgi:hypothetical protein
MHFEGLSTVLEHMVPEEESDSTVEQTLVTRAFYLAVLLTRSLERAEETVTEAIQKLDGDEPLAYALRWRVIKASIQSDNATAQAAGQASKEDIRQSAQMLPLELSRVLQLPSLYRRCFVLRVLAGLSPEVCGYLLDLSAGEVEVNAGRAIEVLAENRAAFQDAATVLEIHA